MEKKDLAAKDAQQASHSREELEQLLRARAWKDKTFREEFLANPKAILARDYQKWFPDGVLPEGITINVVEEQEDSLCFVLPPKAPDQIADIQEIDDKELSTIAGGTAGGGPTVGCTSEYCGGGGGDKTAKCDSFLKELRSFRRL